MTNKVPFRPVHTARTPLSFINSHPFGSARSSPGREAAQRTLDGEDRSGIIRDEESFVGREQDDAVQLAPPAMPGQCAPVLQDVGVHQKRLAAAGGHPEGELVELRPGLGGFVERRDPVGLGLVRVAGIFSFSYFWLMRSLLY